MNASNLSQQRGSGFAKNGDVAVLFDGEIYNERQNGQSDAEVVLDAYKKYGTAFAGNLQGVFACTVIDGDHVMLARDAVGVRPLYHGTTDEGGLCFASEAKALVGLSGDVTELPPETVYSNQSGLSGYFTQYPQVEMPDDIEQAAQQLRKSPTAG